MTQCLKIMFTNSMPINFVQDIVQKTARMLGIEGTAQVLSGSIKIVACGEKEAIDSFLDVLHTEVTKYSIENIEIEPFLKDRDYRGVFRVIE